MKKQFIIFDKHKEKHGDIASNYPPDDWVIRLSDANKIINELGTVMTRSTNMYDKDDLTAYVHHRHSDDTHEILAIGHREIIHVPSQCKECPEDTNFCSTCGKQLI